MARSGLERTYDQVQERGLARPVLTQDAEPVAWADEPGDVVDHGRLAEALCHADQIDDLLAQPGDRGPLQLEGVAQRRFVGDEGSRLLDVELRLGPAGLRPAREPRELLAQQVPALLFGGLRSLGALDTLEHVSRVSALELLYLPVVHLPHTETHFVEKPAVVGDHKERARPSRPAVLEVLGQPCDAVHIEMVGGLVEHEHVEVTDEHAGKIHASPLAAGEFTDSTLPRDIRDKAAKDAADSGVRCPRVLRCVAHDLVGDRRLRIEGVRLFKRPDGSSAAPDDAAVVRLDHTGEEREER